MASLGSPRRWWRWLSAVRDQGCNEVQGFLFSPPVSAQAVTDMLAEEAASRPKLRRVS